MSLFRFWKVSVIGDLNARTGLLCDEPMDCEGIHRYIDSLIGAEFNESQTNSIGRTFSLDKKTDSSGLKLLYICKEACLRIVNGRLGCDKEQGNFNYQSVLGKSVIDYVLFPPEMFDDVTHFAVHDIFTFSDHAPVQISFKVKKSSPVDTSEINTIHKLVWYTKKLECFKNLLLDNLVDLDLLIDRIENENSNINDGVEKFWNYTVQHR